MYSFSRMYNLENRFTKYSAYTLLLTGYIITGFHSLQTCCIKCLIKTITKFSILYKHIENTLEKQIPDSLFERGDASFTSLVIFIRYGDATSRIYERSAFIKTVIKDREKRGYHFVPVVC